MSFGAPIQSDSVLARAGQATTLIAGGDGSRASPRNEALKGHLIALLDEVQAARKKVVTDGYDMSLGELINLYHNDELEMDPVFQRLFRWDDERKTRFIKFDPSRNSNPTLRLPGQQGNLGIDRRSAAFVYDFSANWRTEGRWTAELGPLFLNETQFLPSLDGKRWTESAEGADNGIGQVLQIEIKRARVRVEILKSDSDVTAKFELFKRLNTGGAALTEQEVRNSIAVSVNRFFYDWLTARARRSRFHGDHGSD